MMDGGLVAQVRGSAVHQERGEVAAAMCSLLSLSGGRMERL